MVSLLGQLHSLPAPFSADALAFTTAEAFPSQLLAVSSNCHTLPGLGSTLEPWRKLYNPLNLGFHSWVPTACGLALPVHSIQLGEAWPLRPQLELPPCLLWEKSSSGESPPAAHPFTLTLASI